MEPISVLAVIIGGLLALFGIPALARRRKPSRTEQLAHQARERLEREQEEIDADRAEVYEGLDEAEAEANARRTGIKDEAIENEEAIDRASDFGGFSFRN